MQKKNWIFDRDRQKTSITIEIPVDVIETLEKIVASRKMEGLHELLRYYIGKGLKDDLDQQVINKTTEADGDDSTRLGAIL